MASLLLAFRNLAADRARLSLTVAATGLAVALILLLSGFVSGIDLQVSVYLDHQPGSIVVGQAGVSNLLGASSRLPSPTLAQVSATPGVARAIPILTQFVILDLGTRKQPVYVVGYDPALGGGAWQLASGNQPKDGEAVVDRVLAMRHGLGIGDRITVLGQSFGISGLSDGTASFMTSYIFVTEASLEPLLGAASQSSYILVTPALGTSTETLIQRLSSITGVSVLSKSRVEQNDRDLLARVFKMPLQLMAGIAFAVGVAVVALVMYAATMERSREYGALKAVGAANGYLYSTVFVQALAAALSGSVAGVALALGSAQLIILTAPQLLVAVTTPAILGALGAGIAMAAVASLLPAAALGRLEPAEVLR